MLQRVKASQGKAPSILDRRAGCTECGCPAALHDDGGCTRRLPGTNVAPPSQCLCRRSELAARHGTRPPSRGTRRPHLDSFGAIIDLRARMTHDRTQREEDVELLRRRFDEAAREGYPIRLFPRDGHYYLLSEPHTAHPFVAAQYTALERLQELANVRLLNDEGAPLESAPSDLFGSRFEFDVRGVPRAAVYFVDVIFDSKREEAPREMIRAGAHVAPMTPFCVYLIGRPKSSLTLAIHRAEARSRGVYPNPGTPPEWQREFRRPVA